MDVSYDQNEKLALWLNTFPKTPVLSLFTSYQAWQKNYVVSPNLASIVLDYSYTTAWDKLLTNSVEINRCVSLVSQWTVHVNSVDVCENALKTKSLSQFKCDMDKDNVLEDNENQELSLVHQLVIAEAILYRKGF